MQAWNVSSFLHAATQVKIYNHSSEISGWLRGNYVIDAGFKFLTRTLLAAVNTRVSSSITNEQGATELPWSHYTKDVWGKLVLIRTCSVFEKYSQLSIVWQITLAEPKVYFIGKSTGLLKNKLVQLFEECEWYARNCNFWKRNLKP